MNMEEPQEGKVINAKHVHMPMSLVFWYSQQISCQQKVVRARGRRRPPEEWEFHGALTTGMVVTEENRVTWQARGAGQVLARETGAPRTTEMSLLALTFQALLEGLCSLGMRGSPPTPA